ncbi:hypothetical protein VTO73DRAFT_7720 [Trametes versicolor]
MGVAHSPEIFCAVCRGYGSRACTLSWVIELRRLTRAARWSSQGYDREGKTIRRNVPGPIDAQGPRFGVMKGREAERPKLKTVTKLEVQEA